MKNFSIRMLCFCITMLLLPSIAFSQISIGGSPFSDFLKLDDQVQSVSLPSYDYESMLEEDRLAAMMHDVPLRYGRVFEVNYTLQNSGTWTELNDGSRIWRLKIKSDNAHSINLIFGKYFLPEGATLYVYNPDKSSMIGGFTNLNNRGLENIFATAPTQGEISIIEYFEPKAQKGNGILEISQAIHAYIDLFGFNNLFEEPCHVNIHCPVGAPWVDQKRGVTRITFVQGGGSFLCSGSLINNVAGNLVPNYLTAEHCSPTNHNSMVFYFNYESPTCYGTLGSLANTVSGATFLSANFMTDYRLVRLSSQPPSSFNAYYPGWDRSGVTPTRAISIHHPGGVIKKFSIDTTTVVSSNGFGGRLPNGFWRVIWDIGMTEGGSSGSPLYDQNKRIVGQNLGGNPANCITPWSVQKYFGKFSESWGYGGSPTNQIKDWLDSANTGVMTVDGINAVTGVAPVPDFTSDTSRLPISGGAINFFNLSTNDPQTYQWSFPGGNPTSSTEMNPTNIQYTTTGNYTVSLTATNSHGSNTITKNAFIKVEGVPMSAFSVLNPPTLSSIITNPFDTSTVTFSWGSSSSDPSVYYRIIFKKFASTIEYPFNAGASTSLNIRKSVLDSMAISMGLVVDSVNMTWTVRSFNGADSLASSNAFILTIKSQEVSIHPVSNVVPVEFKLHNNYPNPFNPETKIRFDIPNSQKVSLKIYNMLGKEIAILVNEVLSTGVYEVNWNALNFSSGTYFYRLETDNFVDTKRMVLLK